MSSGRKVKYVAGKSLDREATGLPDGFSAALYQIRSRSFANLLSYRLLPPCSFFNKETAYPLVFNFDGRSRMPGKLRLPPIWS
jgi:hypothetical protein